MRRPALQARQRCADTFSAFQSLFPGVVKKVGGVVDDAVYDFLGRTVNTHTYTHVCRAHAA